MRHRRKVEETSGTGRRVIRRSGLVILATGIAILFGSSAAFASITNPAPNSVQRGVISIHENQGGVNGGCGASSWVTIHRNSDGAQVFSQGFGQGPWSTSWNTVGQPIGSYNIQSWAHDTHRYWRWGWHCNSWNALLSNYNFTIDNQAAVSVSSPSTSYWGQTIPVSAHLRDATTGQPLGNQAITFSAGSERVSASTNANGDASATLPAGLNPGSYTVVAAFARNCCFEGAQASAPLQVLGRPTTLTYNGQTTSQDNQAITLSATLADGTPGSAQNGTPLAGRNVTFSLAGQTATAMTDSSGKATATVHVNVTPGSYPVKASYAGSKNYLASSAQATFTVRWEFAFNDARKQGTVQLNPSTTQFQLVLGTATSPIEKYDLKSSTQALAGLLPSLPICQQVPNTGKTLCTPTLPAPPSLPSPPGTPGLPTLPSTQCVAPPNGGQPLCLPQPPNAAQQYPYGVVAVVAYTDSQVTLDGVFNLATGAFAAVGRIGTTPAALLSAGTLPTPPSTPTLPSGLPSAPSLPSKLAVF
ncbi:MAG: Ig-like domain repeat protein [Acidimicrobiales bacterium]